MKIYDVLDDEGRPSSFEVDNFLFGRRRAVRVVRTISGVRVIKTPGRWAISAPDDFCEFEVGRVRFVVWEPFGDNDRYWIGLRPLRWVPEIEEVREAFARPPVLFDLPPEGPDEFRPFGISNRSLGMLGLVGGITFSWIVPDTRGAFVAWFLVGIGAAFHGLHLIFRYLARPNEQK